MRIGLSLTSLFKQKRDGIFTYTQAMNEQLPNWNCQVVGTSFLENSSVNLKDVDFLGQYEFCLLKQLAGLPISKINELKNKIDLYHITDYRFISLKNKPVIASLHDAVPLKNTSWVNPHLRKIKNAVMKRAVKWVDHVIAISQAAVPDIVEYWGVETSKISVIHLGVSRFWLHPVSLEQKRETLNRYALPEDFILFVGTMQPRKNLERLLKAFKQLPEHLRKNHHLVLVASRGWMDEAFVQELSIQIPKGQVHWIKDISYEELRCLYQSAALFAFPSLYEGFGLPIVEAFASNLPVVTSNVSALPEVANGAALLFDPYNVEDITEKIRCILESSSLREQFVLKGRERAKSLMWDQCVEKTLNLYKKFI